MELYNGSLNVSEIISRWYNLEQNSNNGAFIPFIGIVRAENSISGLSFDIYEPLLKNWFIDWQKKAEKLNAKVKFAHSIGDVPIHTSSYVSAVFSPKRDIALKMIVDFVEDFKANAPIWKYDLIEGKRIYAESRSKKIIGSGILI
jgi:molybdopterin synthase catalytic subunit